MKVGTQISKIFPCPPCPDITDKNLSDQANLVPLSKECHVEDSGEVICICPYGICKDEEESRGDCDGGKCDQVRDE